MPVRTAEATWEGTLMEGSGVMVLDRGRSEIWFSHGSRFKEEEGSNPEELVGAANAGCFSMFLSSLLTNAGFPPTRIQTTAEVHLERDDAGPKITRIVLSTVADVPRVDRPVFEQHAQAAKERCPVSRALAGVEIELEARLL